MTVALTGCGSRTVHGSGRLVTEQRQVPSFNRIEIGGAVALVVQIGTPQSVSLTGDDNIVRIIHTEVQGETLNIHADRPYAWKAQSPQVQITVPSLVDLHASGAITATLTGLSGPRFDLDASGALTVHANGSVDALTVRASGGTDLDLSGLQARTVALDLSGATHLQLSASETITGSASGVSVVTYSGSPTVSVHTTGVSQIQPR